VCKINASNNDGKKTKNVLKTTNKTPIANLREAHGHGTAESLRELASKDTAIDAVVLRHEWRVNSKHRHAPAAEPKNRRNQSIR
jgi:hypothetical protein